VFPACTRDFLRACIERDGFQVAEHHPASGVLEFTGTVKVIPARFGSNFSITIGKVPAWMKRVVR
jgi:hypothetical protein